jgi:FkbM family methyltransferase
VTSVARRAKGLLHRLLRQRGYAIVSDRTARELANPLPVELIGHRALLRALLESRGINYVIDVGAHTGGYATQLRELGYGGEIVSFEPVAAAFEALRARAAGDPRWQAHRLALGRAAGSAPLHVARETNFASFLRPTRFSVDWFGGSAVDHDEVVEVQRLDAVFERLVGHVREPRVLLKTDTQGWDLEVIEGAQGCLESVHVIQIELSLRPIYEGSVDWLDAVPQLRDRGFRPAHLTAVARDAELGVVELDCLLVRDRG